MSVAANEGRPASPQVRVSGDGEHRLRSLADASRAIAGASSVDDLLRAVADAARSIVGVHQAVATRLYDGTWDQAVTYVTLSERYAEYRSYDHVPKGLGVLNVVTSRNVPLRLTGPELAVHPDFRGLRDAPGHPPLPDYLAAPFISRDGANIGLLQLSHKIDESDFDTADEAVCVQLALMVSSALEHVEVAAELEQTLAQLRDEQKIITVLHDVGRAVTSHLEHAEVVQTVTDAATKLTGAQFGAFFYSVMDEDGESYSLYTISGVPREAFSRFPEPRKTEIFAPTFDGQGVVRIDDVTTDPRYGRSAPHYGMPAGHLPVRSYLAVPVKLSGGEVAGALFFGHEDAAVFDLDAERLAVGIAGYAGIALENGRLYDAARRATRARERVAAALERPLQPPVLPLVPGLELASVFQPFAGSGGLAGDFYDAFPVAGDRWLLTLGDVSGKGPEAAAVTGLVRHTLWAAAQHTTDPGGIAHVVNDALLRDGSGRFVTLVIAILTPGLGSTSVEAVWAGHQPGLVLRADGADAISGSGLPLGMFEEIELEPVRFTLGPSETLLLHTDGLVERVGAVVPDERVAEVMVGVRDRPLGEALAHLGQALAEHGQRDDIAVVAVRR